MAAKKKTPKVTEQKIQNSIIKALNQLRFTVWRCNSGMMFIGKRCIRLAPAGTPDIIGYDCDGRFVALEVKLPRKDTTPKQDEWINRAESHNVDVSVVHSLDEALGWATNHNLAIDHARREVVWPNA